MDLAWLLAAASCAGLLLGLGAGAVGVAVVEGAAAAAERRQPRNAPRKGAVRRGAGRASSGLGVVMLLFTACMATGMDADRWAPLVALVLVLIVWR